MTNMDVGSLLAQGMSAVDTVQLYVSACARLGYGHRDLTLHPAQVLDWYRTEEGMDLAALQRDAVAMHAAADAAGEALHVQERQLAQLATAWQGDGGDAARDVVVRHQNSSAAAVAAIRTAADALSALGDRLGEAVDSKVGTILAIDGRIGATRDGWSAAAHTVTTGVGDLAAASECVDRDVTPFVGTVVATEWLAAMREAAGSILASYDGAVAEITAERLPPFVVPDGFAAVCGPQISGDGDSPGSWPATATATSPAGWSAPSPASVSLPAPTALPAPIALPAPTAPAAAPCEPLATPTAPPQMPSEPPPLPAASSPMGAMGSSLPGVGGGLAGFGQQFADALGGLLGGAGGGLPNPADLTPEFDAPDLDDPELDDPELDDPELEVDDENDEGDEEVLDDEADSSDGEVDPDGVDEGEIVADEQVAADAAESADPCPTPAPQPAPAPPVEPLPPAESVVDAQTPCEIAADEVPQVGAPPS